MDRIDALIVSTAARTLDGIRLKASVYRDIACGDAELGLADAVLAHGGPAAGAAGSSGNAAGYLRGAGGARDPQWPPAV